jgi:HlyD family secretion protein
MLKKIALIVLSFTILTCSNGEQEGYTTTGTIEAYKVDIRASAPGKILYNNIPEGTKARSGQLFTVIDTTDLHLQKEQLLAKLDGLAIEFSSINNQEQQLEIRLDYLTTQVNRLEKLVASDGASQDKLDQIIMERDVTRSQLGDIPVRRNALRNQQNQLRKQLDLLEYRISEATIVSPSDGVILQRYVETGERIQPGHLLATVGLTDTVWVMMYIPETKLGDVKLGQTITIEIDGQTNPLQGKVAWIASEAEFTPKTVYTEDTRTSLTYSVRVEVANPNGLLKIGMPVKLSI